MSEVREVVENGEDEDVQTSEENGWLSFVLSSSHPDYDIVCRLNTAALQGVDARSLVKLAGKAYKHILANERSSAGKNRNVEKFPDREAFERSWALAKRETVVNGDYAEGGRSVGPRIAPVDKEMRRIAIERLQGVWTEDKAFPTSGKALINGTSLDDWVKAILSSPKHTDIKGLAEKVIADRAASAAAAKASAVPGANPFASLI